MSRSSRLIARIMGCELPCIMSSDTTLRTKTPQRVALAVMAIAFLVVLTWALYTFLTSKYPGANDFYQRWRGIYAFWVEHRSPYDPAVSAQIELTLYGHRVTAGSSVNEYPGA